MKEHIFTLFLTNILAHTGYSKEELFTKTKNMDIVAAKQMLIYLCVNRGIKKASIKRYMLKYGYNLHDVSISYAMRSTQKYIKEDPDYKAIIDKLIQID